MSVIVQRLLPVSEGTALCQEHVHSQRHGYFLVALDLSISHAYRYKAWSKADDESFQSLAESIISFN